MPKTVAQRLSNTLESLAELRVATGVGEFKLRISADTGGGGGMKVDPVQATELAGLYTEINLISGDVITLVHENYKAKDDPVLAMHLAQVDNGRRIVATNVATIRELLSTAEGGIKGALDSGSRGGS